MTRYAKEHVGEWYGVPIPGWLRVFDCRASDEEITPTAPWGAALWSSERAEVDLGLRRGYADSDATNPVSCHTYIDARTASKEEIRAQLRRMIEAATSARPQGVVAVALGNFGWTVIADRRKERQ